jgi:hypothetical protein
MASASLAKFEFTARTLEMERAGVTLVAMLYVFELVYRDSMRGPMIAHHVSTARRPAAGGQTDALRPDHHGVHHVSGHDARVHRARPVVCAHRLAVALPGHDGAADVR